MIVILFIFIASLCDAIMDRVKNTFNTSIFYKYKDNLWINPSLAWKNKWKNGNPNEGERFFGSSTFLVWTTDLWHFIKFLFLSCIMISIISYKTIINPFIDLILFYLLFTISFEIFWRLFKK